LVVCESVDRPVPEAVFQYVFAAGGYAFGYGLQFCIEDFGYGAYGDDGPHGVRKSMGDVVASAGVTGELGAIGIGDDIAGVATEAVDEGEVFDGSFVFG
jgi:hypothetical protein